MKSINNILVILCIVLAILVLAAGLVENKNALKKEIAVKAYLTAFSCDNPMDAKDWERISYPEMIKFHDRGFYSAITKAAKRYGSICVQPDSAECLNDVLGYIAINSYKLMSFVKSACINPYVNPKIMDLAKVASPAYEVKKNGFLENIAVNFNLNLKSTFSLVTELFQGLPGTGIDYNRKLKINYMRYDKNAKSWGLHLFKSPYGDVTEFNKPLRPIEAKDNFSTFEIDLKKFKGSPEVNFVVHDGSEKDMYGLDMHWPITDKSEIWIVENQLQIFESEEAAKKAFASSGSGKFSVYFLKDDRDYTGWTMHLWNPDNNRNFTEWFSSLSGVLDGEYLRFDIHPKLIGKIERVGFILHKQNLKASDSDFLWKISPRKNLLVKFGQSKITEISSK